jgi:hypothetical protein
MQLKEKNNVNNEDNIGSFGINPVLLIRRLNKSLRFRKFEFFS